jgi:hypothetical protein
MTEDYKNFTFGKNWIPTSLAQRKKMKRIHGKLNRSIREAPRVPRKKGQHRGSKSHSDLYTDENPKGTIKGLKFATVADAKASVSKIRSSGKSHAHKIQAAVAMEQRAREMGKTSQAAVYRAYINKMKKKTKAKNEISFVKEHKCGCSDIYNVERINEKWSAKYKRSIDCSNPKGFSQRAHCQGYTFEFPEDEQPMSEAEYQGRKVKLGKIMQGDTKKFKVYVKNPKGNVVKVNFGQGGGAKGGTMRIRKSNPAARRNFRARHNCDNPGPRHKARYWSCRKW